MSYENTDFLNFSAYSIKDKIVKKLSQDSKFTDQMYEGSNLNVLIDIVSYMYQCMIYQLNNAASESMFNDTQIYENINRLCKFIGYNPKGRSESHMNVYFDNENGKYADQVIRRYTRILTEKTDSLGNPVYFSTTMDDTTVNHEEFFDFDMVNGTWKVYPTIFVTTGQDFEKFELTQIGSDKDLDLYAVHGMIEAYVVSNGKCERYTPVETNLFKKQSIDTTDTYNGNDRYFNVQLNQDKRYTITFGNGINCKKPPTGSLIYLFYLEANSSDVEFKPGEIQNLKMEHNNNIFGITKDLYNMIFQDVLPINEPETDIYDDEDGAQITNETMPTTPKDEESVEDIRNNAPNWFKTGGRLVTKSDYEYFIKNNHRDDVVDVKVMSNTEYLTTFYKWMYDLGKKYHNDSRYYLNQNRIVKYDYEMADPSSSNNVYIWVKCKEIDRVPTKWITQMDNVKTITANPVFLNPINVNFQICAANESMVKDFLQYQPEEIEDAPFNDSYIEITMDSNSLFVNSSVEQQVKQIITKFFDPENFTLGCTINFNELIRRIHEINGVSGIKTVFDTELSGYDSVVRNGLCFATWSGNFIDIADDLEVSNTSKTLEPFQFPVLYSNDIKVKVIKKSITALNNVQY